jgi:ParB family transcriptional regulator, chromosome partitioning protein
VVVAEAVSLDMAGYWPTARSCLGRVTKARILEAVGEGVSDEAADRMDDMKKFDMALPVLLRTAKPAAEQVDTP